MKKMVVLSGAGISAESGIKTFRDSGGLWEGENVEDVATMEGFLRNRKLVLDFYNKRRAELREVSPNKAHFLVAQLEKNFDVTVVTQNIDNLHERAGSSNIIHLHGELTKAQSLNKPDYVVDWQKDIRESDKDPWGGSLRPFIVWFGEAVPNMSLAIEKAQMADYFVIVGTSMVVYPAAGLVNYTKKDTKIFYIDPKATETEISGFGDRIVKIPMVATKGMEKLIQLLEDK